MRFLNVLLMALCLAAPAWAQEKPAPLPSHLDNPLEVAAIITDNTNVIDEWYKTPVNKPFRVTNVQYTLPDLPLTIAFLMNNLKLDEHRRYAGVVSFQIIRPSGEIMFEQKDYAQASGLAPEEYGMAMAEFVMADRAFDLYFGKGDIEGSYNLHIEVLDQVSGQKITKNYPISLQQP